MGCNPPGPSCDAQSSTSRIELHSSKSQGTDPSGGLNLDQKDRRHALFVIFFFLFPARLLCGKASIIAARDRTKDLDVLGSKKLQVPEKDIGPEFHGPSSWRSSVT